MSQLQEQQIARLVNLLMAVLVNQPGSDTEAIKYIFETELYKLIEAEGGLELEHEDTINRLKRNIVEAELEKYE